MDSYNPKQLVREADQFMSQYEYDATRNSQQLDIVATKLTLAAKQGENTQPQLRRFQYLMDRI